MFCYFLENRSKYVVKKQILLTEPMYTLGLFRIIWHVKKIEDFPGLHLAREQEYYFPPLSFKHNRMEQGDCPVELPN